jgi:hypothetical protein
MEPSHATSECVSTDAALGSVLAPGEIDPRSRAFALSSVYHQGPGPLAAPTGRRRRIADLRRDRHGHEEVEASLWARRIDRSHVITS